MEKYRQYQKRMTTITQECADALNHAVRKNAGTRGHCRLNVAYRPITLMAALRVPRRWQFQGDAVQTLQVCSPERIH